MKVNKRTVTLIRSANVLSVSQITVKQLLDSFSPVCFPPRLPPFRHLPHLTPLLSLFSVFKRGVRHLWPLRQALGEHADIILRRSAY